MAETLEWQARCRDLETSLETVREELLKSRLTYQALAQENKELLALIGRLRLHIQQGVEL